MQEYRTYVYKPSKQKARKRLMYNAMIVAALAGVLFMLFIGVLGIGVGIFGAISAIAAIVGMKNYDDKFMGITAYGDRGEEFFISEDHFRIGELKVPYTEIEDLVIYVDEYAGKPREVLGIHHGGNNEITFTHKGEKVSILYIIKDKTDYKLVEALVDRIEQQYEQLKS